MALSLTAEAWGVVQGVSAGWPTPHKLGTELAKWEAKNSVGFMELVNTNFFRSPACVGTFLKHYKDYDFLEPTKVNATAPVRSLLTDS